MIEDRVLLDLKNIRLAMIHADMDSQSELGDAMGVTRQTINGWFAKARDGRPVVVSTAERMAKVLRVNVDQIVVPLPASK